MFGGLHSTRPLPLEQALLDIAREFTPRVQAFGPTPVLLDLHGLGRAWKTPWDLGRALLEAASGRSLELQVALAFSRVTALVVARGCAGLTVVPPGQEATALAPLPLDLLDLSPERHALLRRWGIRTLGDLAALPAKGLAERLGPEGPRLRRLARGEDDSLFVPTPSPEPFEIALDLEWPVDGIEPLSFLLARVLEPLCNGLRARDRLVSVLTLELRLVSGGIHRRVLKPAAPTAAARTWRTLLLLDLEAHPPGDAIRALTVRAEPAPARTVQFSLLDPAQPSPERLAETLARLHEWTRVGRAGAPALLDTHRPGAFAMGTFAPGPVAKAVGTFTVSAPSPRMALRVFRPPLLARVALREGTPSFIAASLVRGGVLDCAGPWRGSGDWWDAEAWSREEWDVALADGIYRIFRDRIADAWFVEGEFD